MVRNKSIDRKLKKKKIGLISVLFVFITAVFFILFTRTSYFNLKNIEIKGNEALLQEEIIIASGLIKGENIFKIDITKVEKNLLLHPYIKDAKVKRVLPNKINIAIKERKTVAVLPYVGSFVYIDDEGIVLNVLASKNDNTIPEIRGYNIKQPDVGKKIEFQNNGNIDDILKLVMEIKKVGLYNKIETIETADYSEFYFYLKDGTKVAFGDLNNVKYKLRCAIVILEEINKSKRGAGFIDFTKGSDPVYKMGDG